MPDIIYKEEVVRWVSIEIEAEDVDLSPSELEDKYRGRAVVAMANPDGEDVLETHYEHKEG